jgi:hypothetical protein
MKNSFLFIILIVSCIVLFSCKKDESSPITPTSNQLEIVGIWDLTDSGGSLSFSFATDSNLTWHRTPQNASGTARIVFFDNTLNTLVFYNTSHPIAEQLHKYMKLTWTPASPTDSLKLWSFQYRATLDSALLETIIFPPEYPRDAVKR